MYIYKVFDLDNRFILQTTSMPKVAQLLKVSTFTVESRLKTKVNRKTQFKKGDNYKINITRELK